MCTRPIAHDLHNYLSIAVIHSTVTTKSYALIVRKYEGILHIFTLHWDIYICISPCYSIRLLVNVGGSDADGAVYQ